MRTRTYLILLCSIVLVNIPAQWLLVRWDLTGDKRYTLRSATKQTVKELDDKIEAEVMLTGELNAGFTRLKNAAMEMLTELSYYGNIQITEAQEKDAKDLVPTTVYERQQNGRNVQTNVYPYIILKYKGRKQAVPLLRNNRGLSGEENLNHSIENLEYAIAEGIHTLRKEHVERIAFIEGHGELSERNTFDISQALSRYFQIDRGVIGKEDGVLDDYKAVIIADPQRPFSASDKYILDQYLMRGGRILWLINGVRFSDEMMSENGTTPVIALDLNLTDQLFRYGIRVNPVLVQDMQCLLVPVDVSREGQQSSFQPMPWTYAPLLLTSEASPITKGVMQVSGTFVSCIDLVGGEDGLKKDILLATSSASCFTGVPAEVNLSDLSANPNLFTQCYVPVAASLEGQFSSIFAHQSAPDSVVKKGETMKQSAVTKQIVVAGGSIARNEWQKGQPLPCGFDRYTQTQFGNRDFIVNAILYLTDENGLINLREKSVALRLLNDKCAHQKRIQIQLISTITPILLLAITGLIITLIRKKRYTQAS